MPTTKTPLTLPSTNDITAMWDLLVDIDDRNLHQQHVVDTIEVVGHMEETKLTVWWSGNGWSYAVRDYGDAGQDRDEHAADLETVDDLRNLIAALR